MSANEEIIDEWEEEYEKPEFQGPWSVCLFLVDQAYGGPEEGGWWYLCGEPVIQNDLPLPTFHSSFADAEAQRDGLEEFIEQSELNKGRREISSVLSEGRYEARICEGIPKYFPAVRPHYE